VIADFVLPLADERATLATVGGKGASLARLARAGLPVPDGIHLTTAAYRRFVAENGLQPRILAALQPANAAAPASLERASQAIAALFAEARMPPEVAGAIAQAYGELPGRDPAVAVRSSATAEDLPEASFAGQQETYLNVSGAEAVLAAAQKCWASLWTARAIGYRARRGITPEDVALAIVVQTLVPAEAAGILFTANPVNGRRDEVVINAAWGLGEAVVGGQVTPDVVRVDKASGGVRERQTADKLVLTVRTAGGTAEQPVPEALRRAPALSDAAAGELASHGARIEQLYGMPMDVEWALADGQISILQARPITALPKPELPAPTDWKLPRGAYAAMRNNIVELMGEPLSPLFATLGLSAVNASMHRTMRESFAMQGVLPRESSSRSTSTLTSTGRSACAAWCASSLGQSVSRGRCLPARWSGGPKLGGPSTARWWRAGRRRTGAR
jgi:pyruvate,water dikinase